MIRPGASLRGDRRHVRMSEESPSSGEQSAG